MPEYVSELGLATIIVILILRELLPLFTKMKNGTNGTPGFLEWKTMASIEEAIRQTNHALRNTTQVTTQLVERVSELRSEVRQAITDCRRKEKP